MSEEDGPSPRFAGRTYSRSRNKPAGRNYEESPDCKPVAVKAAISISKWGNTNYVPVRDSPDGATEPKKVKMESRGEDPFSFDTEDKRKLAPNKKQQEPVVQEQEPRHATRLPASRIVVKEDGYEEYMKVQKEETPKTQSFRTYSRTSPKKPIIMDQFVEVGKKMASGQTLFFSEARLAGSHDSKKEDMDEEDEEDDETFTVQFKRDPLKTYSGEVVTPVDKPDSPPQRKSGYKRKGGPRGRKPLTVSDPELIEEYKRNYAAQQLKEKPDASTKGLSNSTVVSKKEVANEAQGTTVVVVCKPKAQVEKGEVQTKYFARNSKPKGTLVPVISDAPDSHDTPGENGNTDSTSATPAPASSEAAPTRTSARLRNVYAVAPKSDKNSPSGSSTLPAPTKGVTRGRNSSTSTAESALASQTTPLGENSSQSDATSGHGGKRYRIFKSRTPHVEEDRKSATFQEDEDMEEEEATEPASDKDTEPSGDTQVSSLADDKTVFVQIDAKAEEVAETLSVAADTSTPCDSVEPSDVIVLEKDCSIKQIDPSITREQTSEHLQTAEKGNKSDSHGDPQIAARLQALEKGNETDSTSELQIAARLQASEKGNETDSTGELQIAARLRTAEKGNETDSTDEPQIAARLRTAEKGNETDSPGEPDNASECSEQLNSQESPSSSQNVLEESSQKESSASAPRKFFKSKKSLSSLSDLQRKLVSNSPQKSPAKATYNARSWYNKHEADGDKEEEAEKTAAKENNDGVVLVKESGRGPKLKREVHWPTRQYDEAYTSLKVSKTHKELYTVVHNVKQTHEVQELGETQDFMDEVDYLLDSLQDTNSTTIRCLSCLKLAGKCISPAFRMHLRAHGTVTKIFSLLHDACLDPCLALSTSSMMFMLSRDRLNMDLDQDSLNLMLKLNEVDAADRASLDAPTLRDLEKTKQKVKELLAQLQQETHAREIDLGFVSTGNLAMESLLSLTSRRAGEWFKEELRSAGGLDQIVETVKVCENSLPEDMSQDIQMVLPVLRKLDRCLRVLENISFMNSDNQTHLIAYKNAALLQACTRTLRLCQTSMPAYKMLDNIEENKALKDLPGYTILTCMLCVLRVLLNVTHEHQLGNLDINVETSLMETIVRCLTSTLWCVPAEQRFDLAVLCLGLLINLVEHREANRQIMMSLQTQVKYTERSPARTMSAIRAVVELFVQRDEAARQMEEDTVGTADNSVAESPNKSGEWKETEAGIQWITNNLKMAKEEEEKLKQAVPPSDEVKADQVEGDGGNQSILEDDEETFTKALHKAGKHMENSIVASYAGLLLGSTIIDNKEYASSVKSLIPNEDFGPMIKMLKKFLNFMSLTTAFGSTDVNGITKVIDVLESAGAS